MSDLASLYQEHLTNLLSRHRQIMAEQQLDYLIVPSGQPIRIYQDDMDYPFKSSFMFRTYLPLTELPYSFVVIGLTGKPALIYFQPQDYWHSAPADPEGVWPEHFNIQVVSQQGQAQQFMPTDSNRVAFLGEPTDVSGSYSQAQINPKAVINAIYWQRAYKSDYEIECLRRANQKGAYAHTVAEQAFRAGKSEQQIQLAYVESTGMLEHQMPYGNIVALNQNGAVLHYTDIQTKAPEQTRSFLIDAGVSVNGYHSDITRTYSYENDEFAELIHAMDKVQLDIIDSVKTNQNYIDLHISAHLKIAGVLKQFGFVDMPAEAVLDAGITAAFFPHGLGHLIGLQVHDIGGHFLDATGQLNPPPAEHPFCRSTRKMEVGMAFTIEPGLYFIDMLLEPFKQSQHNSAFNWDKIEAFKPFGGVRIEDTIVIQQNGVENITRDAFAAL